MGSPVENKNAALAFPTATTAALRAPQTQGVFRYASSATAASVAIPAAWKDRFLRFRFFGAGLHCDVACTFGSTPTLVIDQASAVGTGHIAAGARLDDGGQIDGIVPWDATYLAWVSSATGGYVEFWISENGAVGNRT